MLKKSFPTLLFNGWALLSVCLCACLSGCGEQLDDAKSPPTVRVFTLASEQQPLGQDANITANATANVDAQATPADFLPVTRIQNTTLYGAYFFTIYDAERAAALVANPLWQQEGTAFWASVAAGANLSPVHRFRNLGNGSHW
jgi:hypothetical protein